MHDQKQSRALAAFGAVIGIACGIAAALVSLWTLSAIPIIGLFSDSVDYLVVADFYRQSIISGSSDADLSAQFAATRFPPMYPALLGSVGAGIGAPVPAFVLGTALLAICVILSLVLCKQETGRTASAAMLLPLAIVTPQIMLWTLLPLSEPLFMAMLLSILIAANLHQRKSTDVLIVALLVALLPFARTAGLAVTAGFIVWLMRLPELGRTRRLVAALAATLPILGWTVFRSTQPVSLAYSDQLSIERMLTQHGTLVGFLTAQAEAVFRGWSAWLDPYLSTGASAAAMILLILALLGWGIRLRSWKLDALCLPPYVAMVIVWPFPAETPRLVGVMAPVIALCAWEGARRLLEAQPLVRHYHNAVVSAAFIAAIALVATVPAWWELSMRASATVPDELSRYKRWQGYLLAPDRATARVGLENMAHVVGMIDALPRTLPSDDCVYTQFAALVWAQTRGAVRARDLPVLTDERMVDEQLRHCNYVLALNLTSPQHGTAALYPLNLISQRSKPVLLSKFSVADGEVYAAVLLRQNRSMSNPAP